MRIYKLGIAATCGLICALSSSTVFAQEANTRFGFQIERYEPSIAGTGTFGVERPWYSSERWFSADFTLDYGKNPAWIGVNRGGGSGAIDHQLVGHLNLAFSFLDRFNFGISFQETLYEGGSPVNGAEPLQGSRNGGTGFGDPRITGFLRIFGHSDHSPIAMHIGAHVWIPRVGDANQLGHDGDADARVMPMLVLDGRAKRAFRWSFNFGYLWRDDAKYTNLPTNIKNVIGDEVRVGLELAYTSQNNRFNIGPEMWFSSHALNDKFFHKEFTSLELFLSMHYLIADMFRIGFGIGGAPQQDIGTPQMRAMFRFAYAPVRKRAAPVVVLDSDHDGIPDNEDACPGTPGVRTSDPKTNGCPPPPPDRDHDGIVDSEDLCPDEPAGDHPDPKRTGCPAKDSDGDGVYDYEDQCPDTPAGPHPDPNKKGCPAVDSDGDGVFDYEDKCPQEPAGIHPETDPAKLGCPKPDRDHDTVPDDVDACPDKPGAPSPDPKKNGCPGLVEVKNGVIVIFQPVFFATGKDTILSKSFPVLNAVADALKAEPEVKKVMIEGHTDNKGKASKNMELSDRRARSVMNYLIGKGVAADRLDAQGYGDSKPVASNKTSNGRAANRRVEFHIVDPPQGGAATPSGQPPAETKPPVEKAPATAPTPQ
jgi:outer membrane protein OmpA-like peptidoglycan-associated protein